MNPIEIQDDIRKLEAMGVKMKGNPPFAASRGSARLWYYARVKNNSGMHTVFYATTKPAVGATCAGIATPNRITGYWRRPAPNSDSTTQTRHLPPNEN